MMRKTFINAGLLILASLVLAEGAGLYDRVRGVGYVDILLEQTNSNGSNNTPATATKRLLGWQPVSNSIWGNVILIFLYGIILAFSAKLISDGAELLLDLGLPAGIIGGVVLPLLGAVPDSAMILASGVAGDRATAQKQIDVGMGTLAGSTIMLLTIPWLGSLILGRVDIINGQGKDKTTSPFQCSSFWKQGVTVLPDVTRGAIVMLITMLPYFIIQGADWHHGPTKGTPVGEEPNPKPYIRDTALVTGIISLILFVLYLVYQVLDNVNSQRKAEKRDQEKRQRDMVQRVLKQFMLAGQSTGGGAFGMTAKKEAAGGEEGEGADETQPLVPAAKKGTLQKKYFGAWKMSKATGEEANEGATPVPKEEAKEEEDEAPKWRILTKCIIHLVVGVILVTGFSDPMVSALTDLTDTTHKGKNGSHLPIPTFYVAFIVTPLCSNASELVSSLIFASRRTKVNISLTYSQLYGAAAMNNTLGLGIFAMLVYIRQLDWEYSAEVSVIIFIEVFVGILAVIAGLGFRNTYLLWLGFLVGSMYFVAIGLVALLENVAHWK